MTRLTSPAVALASPCPECLAAVPDDTAPLPKAGFYSCAAGRFFVSKTGLVFELLDEELDGPEEALVALLPPDAEPMPAMYLLPSFVLRIAARTGLDVPTPLRAPPAAELLDELHWRGDGGWAPVAGEDLRTLAALAAGNFVALADGSARVGDAAVEVLDRLTHALCDAPFGDSAPLPAALRPCRDRGSYRGAFASVADLGNILRPVLGIDAGLPLAERERIARELRRRGELWFVTHDDAVHVFVRPGSPADLLLADERPPLAQPRYHERTS